MAGMATACSFDITSNVDLQEVDNALNQARKEVAQRYDFKGSKAAIEFNAQQSLLTLVADDEFKLNALWDIVQTRLVRRNVPVRNLSRGTITPAGNSTVRQDITLQQGIPSDKARDIIKFLKDSQAQEGPGHHPERPAPRHVAFARRAPGSDAPAPGSRFRRRPPVRQLPGLRPGAAMGRWTFVSLVGLAFLVWFVLVLLFTPRIDYHLPGRGRRSAALRVLQEECQARLHTATGRSADQRRQFYPAMLAAIREAHHSINVEAYIFEPGRDRRSGGGRVGRAGQGRGRGPDGARRHRQLAMRFSAADAAGRGRLPAPTTTSG